jgi:RNA polymerase sigma factor (sigma-70 family)
VYSDSHKNISDIDLLTRYQASRDAALLGILYDRYALLVLGICMKYLKDEEAAKDSMHQVFLKGFQELLKYNITHFKAWICQIARNYCLMQLRTKKWDHLPEDASELRAEEPVEVQALLLQDEILDYIPVALASLNTEQQTCIRLFYLEQKSYQEIADSTSYSIKEVKSYIQNGKRNLKKRLEALKQS